MSGELKKVYDAKDVWANIDFNYIPFGNAYYGTEKCMKLKQHRAPCWASECMKGGSNPSDPACYDESKMVCQHGEAECVANRLEGCVISLHPDPNDYLPFMWCYEGKHKSKKAFAKECATEAKLDYDAIEKCAAKGSAAGDAADKANAMATAALGPDKKYVPWVTVDGTVVANQNDLLKDVCAKMSPKPKGCSRSAFEHTFKKVLETSSTVEYES